MERVIERALRAVARGSATVDAVMPTVRAALTRPQAGDGVGKLRSDIFEVLRRHDVSEQCVAEVAMLTHAARPQAVDGVELRAALEHEFCGWQVDDPREAAGTILAVLAHHTAQSRDA